MRHKNLIKLVFFVALLSVISNESVAQTELWVHDEFGQLARVDVATGDVEVVGNLGIVLTDIAFAPDGQTLFGLSEERFVQVDPITAQVFDIGAHGIPDANALVFNTDGTLYAASATSSFLYEIDLNTADSTQFGDIGFFSAGDLAFNDGDFFLSSTSDELIEIDLLNNASGTTLGNIGFTNVFGLATAADGTLFGVSDDNIFSINTQTGAGTFVTNFDGLGTAFGSSFTTEAIGVPEPSSILLLVAIATCTNGRRKRST